ncbi:AraC family transcriptional regulator [Parabacteroides sp. Marseille-P3160]|uniref:AraC family transcriptional regulator n=1 Tax=Parabacteroides sp. Marseille-P3160 TaxID=1917887 RepID=UPI001F2EDE24|nr:AraC family transcriptional regulator [Parabacteroides sp. Marseille-P3160]
MEVPMMNEQLAINEQNPIIARFYDYDYFTYPWHFHREYEIIYVKESFGERFVGDNMEYYQAGDLILIGSNLPHYMRSNELFYKGDPELRVKGAVIQFSADFMSWAIGHYADFIHIKTLLEKAGRGIHFPYPENKEIIPFIEELPAAKGFDRIVGLLFLLDKMAKFHPKRLLCSPRFSDKLSEVSDSRIEKLLSYLNYHYTENLRLDNVASIMFMNTSAFCRYFKQKTGKSYVNYVQELRIGYACKLLLSTSYDISQISIECGFNTICHFNKVFKHRTGLVPSEYKKLFMQNR